MPASRDRSQHVLLHRGGIRPAGTRSDGRKATARRAAKDVGPVCYFVMVDGLVKIGTSINLVRRLGILQADLSDVLWVEPGGTDREAELHAMFAAHHAWGERFHPCPAIDSYIAQHRTAAGF